MQLCLAGRWSRKSSAGFGVGGFGLRGGWLSVDWCGLVYDSEVDVRDGGRGPSVDHELGGLGE